MIIDGNGVYGSLLHYTSVIAFTGSALFVFIYLWWKGKLDMDEEPKMQMMQKEEEEKK